MSHIRELLLSEDRRAELSIALFKSHAFGIEEDTEKFRVLKSGRLSPHYFDARGLLSNVVVRTQVAESMAQLIGHRETTHERERSHHDAMEKPVYDHLVGTPEAMTSYAAISAHISKRRLLQPRVDIAKATGNKAPILGEYASGDSVAAVDDVLTDGDSKIKLFKSLGDQGLWVRDYFVVVDREEGGREEVFQATGLRVVAALGVSSMMEVLESENLVSQTQSDNVRTYLGQYS